MIIATIKSIADQANLKNPTITRVSNNKATISIDFLYIGTTVYKRCDRTGYTINNITIVSNIDSNNGVVDLLYGLHDGKRIADWVTYEDLIYNYTLEK